MWFNKSWKVVVGVKSTLLWNCGGWPVWLGSRAIVTLFKERSDGSAPRRIGVVCRSDKLLGLGLVQGWV